MSSLNCPVVASTNDIELQTSWKDGQYLCHSFTYLTTDDKVWHGSISKKDARDYPTMDEINKHLQHVLDDRIYPEKPTSSPIRVAAPDLQNTFIKRPRFNVHNEEDSDWVGWAKKVLLHEASIMEQIPPHPNIITYHGCRIHRGRITGIVLEHLENTLYDSPDIPPNKIDTFLSELQSALDHIHSLGLAHNDISSRNIMIKDGHPILIDFGGCAPTGSPVNFAGSTGWCKEPFHTSEIEHDTFSMGKLRTWLEDGGKEKERKEIMALQ